MARARPAEVRYSPAALLGRAVAANNRAIVAGDHERANPRSLDGCRWHEHLVAALPAIRDEWRAFDDAGGVLPRIEDVLGEGQGNIGAWRAAILWSGGAPAPSAARWFPATAAALTAVPGLRAALWSAIEPATILTEHRGPNAGVLRYHLGVDCPPGSTLTVGDRRIPYVDDEGILFDDTERHAAFNGSAHTRVTLFCEVDRPLPRRLALVNGLVQRALGGRSRRVAVARSEEWLAALNPSLGARPG